jgi:hypothetical protein
MKHLEGIFLSICSYFLPINRKELLKQKMAAGLK